MPEGFSRDAPQFSAIEQDQGVTVTSMAEIVEPEFRVGSRFVPSVRAVVVDVHGAVDMVTAPELEREIRVSLANGPDMLIVDLSSVSFLASVGLAVLMHAHDSAEELTDVRVVVGDAAVSKSLRITGLDSVLELFRSLDAALAA